MADLDWSKCEAVESLPEVVSGAWVFKNTRVPVSVIFANLAGGASMAEIMENFHISKEQYQAVLAFALDSLDSAPNMQKRVGAPSFWTEDKDSGEQAGLTDARAA